MDSCVDSHVSASTLPFEIHNVLIIHREMHLRFVKECRTETHNVWHWLFCEIDFTFSEDFNDEDSHIQISEISNYCPHFGLKWL